MLKTVTITTHDRPEYLRRALRRLHAAVENSEHDYHLYAGVEPGCQDCVDQLMAVDNMPVTLIRNGHKLGVRDNPFRLLTYVFEVAGSDMNVYIEEDVVISPDVFRMADWYSREDDSYFSLQLFNKGANTDNLADLVPIGSEGFSALGFVMKKGMWPNLKRMWYANERGWDWSVCEMLAENDMRMITPTMSRSNHIGREGTNMTPDLQDRVYEARKICELPGPFDYKIVD